MRRTAASDRWALPLGRMIATVAGLAAGWVQAAQIVGVSPQGEVSLVRQVSVRFSEAVVPLGDLRQPDPASVDCRGAAVPAGAGRWANDRSWLYDFREPLPPGTRCALKLRADWQPLAGSMTGAETFLFNTGGPAIIGMQPRDGQTIDEDQFFMLRLNGPAVEASVIARAWCEVDGIGERLPVRVVGGDARAQLLKVRRIDTPRAARTLVLACQRPLPNGAAMRLVWGSGIAAAANPSIATAAVQRYGYMVRAAFTAEFSCERERANAPCLPIRPMSLRFSAPVARALAAQVRLVPASGAALAPVFDPDDHNAELTQITFPKPVAENTRFTVTVPRELTDNASRTLANATTFPLAVATGEAPPIAKFAAAPFGIIEREADAMLPVTLRHVQGDLRSGAAGGQVRVKTLASDADIIAWHARLQHWHEAQLSARELGLPERDWFRFEADTDAKGRTVQRRVERFVGAREVSLLKGDATAKRLDLPQLAGGDPRPFEVVGIPLPEPGYHVVEIESARLGASLLDKAAPMFVRTGVLVTNLGVHFKLGRENSVVWVTTLDRGKPVAGAQVAIDDCTGQRLWSGQTDANGLATAAQAFDAESARCPGETGLFVIARKRDTRGDGKDETTDLAFVFSSWQKGIESWRFNVPTGRGAEPDMRAASVLDRSLFRAGETVSMKHFIRIETSAGLASVKPEALPTRLKIIHDGSGEEFVQPLAWRGSRSAANTWAIPPAAKLGMYRVVLERESGDEQRRRSWTSGNFRVEAFRAPLVDARLIAPKAVPIAPTSLAVGVQLNYFAGGGMARAPARASALLKRRSVSFDGEDGFSFEPPRDVSKAAGSSGGDEDSDAEPEARDAKLVADKLPLTTDASGAASFTLKDFPKITQPSEITAEVTFNDPNGEVQTASAAIALWPSAVVIGVKAGSWASERGRVKFSAIALDTSGRPIKGQQIAVRGRLAQTISTRKRMVGGFYAYDNRTEVKDLGPLCDGTTDDRGLLLCDAELTAAGQVELIAASVDAQGHPVEAAASVWVTKQGELWFAQDNDDRIDVLPEKKRYEPGETAHLQVRMPYREATALVAVEREGVISTRVVTLRGDDPTVALKIEKNWGPNVYVSVLALRGRLRDVPWYSFFTWGWKEPLAWARSFWYERREYRAPTAMVDLAKPSFKLGVAALKVGIAAHELQVGVTADKPQYAVRQKALARIKVSFEGRPVAGAQVAFAAVDEGLLALRDNASWDLLNTMIQARAWGVETSTAQSEIIGRRHYGRKAVAAGGGGGRSSTRELFDTLLLWRADVTLDANGEALVEVPLNDSLTSFRLVAIADAGADAGVQQFGSGSTRIRVTQDLQVLSGLPPLVRDGDRFSALLTLRNTTARAMTVNARLQGTATVGGAGLPINLPPQTIALGAGAARELSWPIDVPAETTGIVWEAAVEAQDGSAKDRLKVTQRVVPAVPVRVMQATLQPLDGSLTLPIAAPADALPETGVKRGGIAVGVQPKLTGALPGMRRFFEAYPFSCLEQKTSKSVGLKDAALWSAVANTLPTYLDSDGLASYFPPRADEAPHGSDSLTAYVLSATREADFALPAPARDAMLNGLAAFIEGRIERKFWSPRSDLDVRKLAAIAALSRYGRAQPKMLGSVNLTPHVWPTAAVIDWLVILKQVDGIPNAAQRLAEANQILRSRLTYAGTTLRFSNEDGDFWWWLMDSADANAAKLILAVIDDPAWRDDLPRMVVGSLARQRRGAWLTTTANLWGSLALDRFAKTFEAVAVAGKTIASTGDKPLAIDWARQAEGGVMPLPWPVSAGNLSVTHEGAGKPWLTVQSLAAVPLKAPVSAGYSIVRSVTAVEQKDKTGWSRGDVLRVRLEIDAQSDMTWVVVADPVPGGATILGSGLGRDSTIATRSEGRNGRDGRETRAWPAFEERGFDVFRSYYEVLPRGKHVVEYSVRLNNPGRFAMPTTRVEAMYSPETFGELPNAAVEVRP